MLKLILKGDDSIKIYNKYLDLRVNRFMFYFLIVLDRLVFLLGISSYFNIKE